MMIFKRLVSKKLLSLRNLIFIHRVRTLRSFSSSPTKSIILFAFSVAYFYFITWNHWKNETKQHTNKNKQKSIQRFVPPTNDNNSQQLFGVRHVSPSSAGIKLLVLLVVQLHHLLLLPAHRKNHKFSKRGQ